jgi:hypothetical protein
MVAYITLRALIFPQRNVGMHTYDFNQEHGCTLMDGYLGSPSESPGIHRAFGFGNQPVTSRLEASWRIWSPQFGPNFTPGIISLHRLTLHQRVS